MKWYRAFSSVISDIRYNRRSFPLFPAMKFRNYSRYTQICYKRMLPRFQYYLAREDLIKPVWMSVCPSVYEDVRTHCTYFCWLLIFFRLIKFETWQGNSIHWDMQTMSKKLFESRSRSMSHGQKMSKLLFLLFPLWIWVFNIIISTQSSQQVVWTRLLYFRPSSRSKAQISWNFTRNDRQSSLGLIHYTALNYISYETLF